MPETSAIEVRGVTKSFGIRPALRGIDLTISPGECVVLFGPNGAGKTTLLKILATIMSPSSGSVLINGLNPKDQPEDCRKQIGVVSHQTFLYGNLTGHENLDFYSRMFGVAARHARIREVADLVGMGNRLGDRVNMLSRGMQQRLSIARALLHRPEIMLLDEPDTGLDQEALAMLWQVIRQDRAGRRTIIMTSHNLERGLEMGDRLLIMARGRLVHDCAAHTLDLAGLKETYFHCVGASA